MEIVHDLTAEEKICAHDLVQMVEIGVEVSEQLDIIPAQVRVLHHVRKKYGCPECQQGVKTAALPPQPIPRSMASPGLLAHITVRRCVLGCAPGDRAEGATLATWMVKLGILVQPLINLLREVMLGYDVMHIDETTVQVLKEPGKTPESKSYLWV